MMFRPLKLHVWRRTLLTVLEKESLAFKQPLTQLWLLVNNMNFLRQF